jgi:hypothetical protein
MVKGTESPDDPALASYWADRRRRARPPAGPIHPELLDLLVTTELVGKAESATDKERARRQLAATVEVLLEVTDSGGERR